MKFSPKKTLHTAPSHPWVSASLIVLGLAAVALAVFWIRKCRLVCVHPKLVDDMYRVIFLKTTAPGTYSAWGISIAFFNIFEVRLEEDLMSGDVIFFDFKNFSFQDFAQNTPTAVTKYFAIYEKVFSLRIKAVHMINAPSAITGLLAIVKMIIKPKIFERISVHQDDAIVKTILSEELAPSDYGGQGPSLSELHKVMSAKYVEYKNRFDTLDILRVDESLRPEKLTNSEQLGFYGNFKKLDVE